MKNFWIFPPLFILATLQLKSQDTLSLYQVYASFSNPEKTEWTAFQNNWNYFEYTSLKEKYKIKKLNCKNCESFYADVYIEIDSNGKVILARCLKAMHCGLQSTDKALFADFENSVKTPIYKTLKHKKFIVRLGHVLKC